MIIQAKSLQFIPERQCYTRVPCQFHIKEVEEFEAEPQEEWANPDRPETRVIFKTGKEFVIQFHFGALSKLHLEYHKCEIIKGE